MLLTSMYFLTFNIQPVKADGIIYIRENGNIDPSSAPVSTMDNITYFLTGSIYNSSIVVERDNIVFDGSGYIIQGLGELYSKGIDLSYRTKVTVRNTEVRGFDFGIYLSYSYFTNICQNNLTNNERGITSDSGSEWVTNGNSLSENNVTNNWIGFDIEDSSNNNSVHGNNIRNNTYGICVWYSKYNEFRNNAMAANTYNIKITGRNLPDYVNDVDASNTVNGKPVYYWINEANKAVPLDAGYVGLVNCTNMTVQGLDLRHNGEGLLLAGTTNSSVTRNNITQNEEGIYVDKSSQCNSIYENDIVNNSRGIVLKDSSNNNTILENDVTENQNSGVYVTQSNSNSIIKNKIAENGAGIWLGGYSNYTDIVENEIANNDNGIWSCWYSNHNNITLNNILCNSRGIWLGYVHSDYNRVDSNNITDNAIGIWLENSSNNQIHENNITSAIYNDICIVFYDPTSSNNIIYHNIFATWPFQVQPSGSTNVWDDGYPSGGNYWSSRSDTDLYSGPYQNETGSDGIGDTPYVIDANNVDHYPLAVHNVAVIDVNPFKTHVGQGYSTSINITVANRGSYVLTCNITLHVNSTAIATIRNVILTTGNTTTITLKWNSTGFALGEYTISAEAEPILDEITTIDNLCVALDHVLVTLVGDVTGIWYGFPDGKVDMRDIGAICGQFGTMPVHPNWNPNMDINDDGVVNMRDIGIACTNFGKSIP